ncbi:hypothetical protein SAMN05192563_103665 [Paraburkholderia aspalathi]|uniref:Uncharacterized protein n=1 Tax=Paraburkholderia aspalathi TaxID=1324617 RepID=A0A1I7ENG4_9BURK|nr:hypothetical protein SAMN05192563_103665 [Paraburkholderia aspalathi]
MTIVNDLRSAVDRPLLADLCLLPSALIDPKGALEQR